MAPLVRAPLHLPPFRPRPTTRRSSAPRQPVVRARIRMYVLLGADISPSPLRNSRHFLTYNVRRLFNLSVDSRRSASVLLHNLVDTNDCQFKNRPAFFHTIEYILLKLARWLSNSVYSFIIIVPRYLLIL
jgi:hypothetical protein